MKIRHKLALILFAVGIAFFGVSSLLYYFNFKRIVTESQLARMQRDAAEVANDINNILIEKAKTAATLGHGKLIVDALVNSNTTFGQFDEEARDKKIAILNDRWMGANDVSDSIIQEYLTNPAALQLKEQQARFEGEYGEIFLTNKYGALVASTTKLTTFAHGHKYWWKGAYQAGQGAVFFDDRGYDDSVGGYVLGVVVPVKRGGEIIGILKCNLNVLGAISRILRTASQVQNDAELKLVRSGGAIVYEEGEDPLSTQLDQAVHKVLGPEGRGSAFLTTRGSKQLFGFSPVKISTRRDHHYHFGGSFQSIDHEKGNRGEYWCVAKSEEMDAVLAPLVTTSKTLFMIGSGLTLVLAFVSVLIGRGLSKPVQVIVRGTKAIGEGRLDERIEINSRDELGEIAQAFNDMADQLKLTTASKDDLEAEIQKRDRVEKALRLLEFSVEHASVSMFRITPEGIIEYANDAACKDLGRDVKELIGANIDEIDSNFPSDTRTKHWQKLKQNGALTFETQYRTKDGDLFPVEVTDHYLRYEETEYEFTFAVDITERKRARQALQHSHQRFLRVLDSIDATIYVADMETYEVLFMNRYMIETFGRDMTGDTCWKVFRGESGACPHCTNDQLLDSDGKPTGVHVWQGLNPVTGRWYINHDRAIEWIDGRLVRLQIATDITELKRMEKELRQAHKMEAIGTLAGGIAHDFNNILSIIVGNTELAMASISEWYEAQEYLKEAKAASLRARDLVSQMLLFAREKEQTLSAISVDPIAKESLKMIRASIPSTVEIHEDIQERLPPIYADPSQIQQIIMNLCTNASQVMEAEGGTLDFKLESIELAEDLNTMTGVIPSGPYVRMQVRDTGPGIPHENLPRIFDPFFTTKGVGEGTGLGLAVVHGIVQDRNGGITIDSQPGKGTTFSVYLPKSDEAPEEDQPVDKTERRGSERILLVDDEPMIMKLGQRMLERQGYEVETCGEGKSALEKIKEDPKRFDLVVTDMTMPGMRGDRLAEEIMAIRPDIPVILSTGYSKQISNEKAREMGIRAFVMKPLTQHELANTVREVLDEQPQK